MVYLIFAVLFCFALIHLAAEQLCRSGKDAPVVAAVSDIASSVGINTAPSKVEAISEPLSWEPLLRQIAQFFLKVCP